MGLLAMKTIVLTSFTFDSHPLCNFRKKQVIREGRLNALAKKQFEIILFTFDSQTVRRHSIFAKKKVTQEGGLATLTKKDWIHLIYFLTNALCNFLKRKEIIKVGGLTPLVKKDWFHLSYV